MISNNSQQRFATTNTTTNNLSDDIVPVQFIHTFLFFLVTTLVIKLVTDTTPSINSYLTFFPTAQIWGYKLIQNTTILNKTILIEILTLNSKIIYATNSGANEEIGSGSFG